MVTNLTLHKEKDRDRGMRTEDQLVKPTDKIYDLVDVIEDEAPEVRAEREIIVIDGRVYERVLNPEDRIYDLNDVLEEGERKNFRTDAMDDEIRAIAAVMAERIAREVVPGIAERVIREEIEKLKSGDEQVS